MRVLVTGGAGYIGTHLIVELLQSGHDVLSIDSHYNSSPSSLAIVKKLTGRDFGAINADVRDLGKAYDDVKQFKPEATVHLAGLKSVRESSDVPLLYYDYNVRGSVALLEMMDAVGCKRLVFSSSATVYGEPDYLPFDEAHAKKPVNPYGRTKWMVEQVIGDWVRSDSEASAVVLRYFNPVGAHISGEIGEDPLGIPNNLLPFIAQVAVGRRPKVLVYGGDYPTADGTAERDYIHVVDLARAHEAALHYVASSDGFEDFNVGTGTCHSVLEMIKAFEAASTISIPFEIVGRREGDICRSFANVQKIQQLLGWSAEYGLNKICSTAWRWQSANPEGFAKLREPVILQT